VRTADGLAITFRHPAPIEGGGWMEDMAPKAAVVGEWVCSEFSTQQYRKLKFSASPYGSSTRFSPKSLIFHFYAVKPVVLLSCVSP
jgi:hypothetical protein